jgi:hypothetical protein
MPSAMASCFIESKTRNGSAVEVVGDQMARSNVLTRGSIFFASASVMDSRVTPLALPRRSNSSSCGSSDASRATTSLPHLLTGIFFCSQ